MSSEKSRGPIIDQKLLAQLVCPRCYGELALDEQRSVLDCDQCRLRYPIENGIPIMLPDEAEQY